MKKPAPLTINLLPKDPFFSTPLGKFLRWALSVGRYLVIFTELIVILSFGARFTLDRRITDLNSTILQKKIIIESYGDLEQEVRDTQKKLESYSQAEQQQNLAEAFPALSEITPQDVTLESLSIQPGRVVFTGLTKSNTSLSILINNIQLSPKFSDISVNRIETKSNRDPGFHFSIQANVKSGETNPSAP
jgi:Tfp pilus assembly protein PilN